MLRNVEVADDASTDERLLVTVVSSCSRVGIGEATVAVGRRNDAHCPVVVVVVGIAAGTARNRSGWRCNIDGYISYQVLRGVMVGRMATAGRRHLHADAVRQSVGVLQAAAMIIKSGLRRIVEGSDGGMVDAWRG